MEPMRTHLPALAALVSVVAAPVAAEANDFSKPAPPLATVLEAAGKAQKPVLLDFSAVW